MKDVNVTQTSGKLMFSIADVATQTTLSKAFVRLEIKRGKLKSRNFGRRVLILAADLKSYLNGEKND